MFCSRTELQSNRLCLIVMSKPMQLKQTLHRSPDVEFLKEVLRALLVLTASSGTIVFALLQV
jgi:hypothetical protein